MTDIVFEEMSGENINAVSGGVLPLVIPALTAGAEVAVPVLAGVSAVAAGVAAFAAVGVAAEKVGEKIWNLFHL